MLQLRCRGEARQTSIDDLFHVFVKRRSAHAVEDLHLGDLPEETAPTHDCCCSCR